MFSLESSLFRRPLLGFGILVAAAAACPARRRQTEAFIGKPELDRADSDPGISYAGAGVGFDTKRRGNAVPPIEHWYFSTTSDRFCDP